MFQWTPHFQFLKILYLFPVGIQDFYIIFNTSNDKDFVFLGLDNSAKHDVQVHPCCYKWYLYICYIFFVHPEFMGT